MERAYRKMARDLMKKYGPLKRVEYLSHFPEFNIKFVFESKTVYSGKRRGRYDIHFMSLGYFGEGPRYAKSFLDEAGFSMTSKKIANIRPGAVINLKGRKVVVSYPDESFLIRLLQFMNNIDEKLDSPCLAIKLIRYLFLIIFRGLFILYILIMKKDENE
ncbi:MAG: hypothetical protein JW976_06075 [Syntrophaceae bacterium]|nr:hypothetical protein [Syntrophaceae bacterium]